MLIDNTERFNAVMWRRIMEEEKDQEFEIGIDVGGAKTNLKIKNYKSRVLAQIGDIIIDKLSYYRWNNALKFLDKYNMKKKNRKIEGKEVPLPPKFIFEILDNAFQEDDDILQNEWNNILVNWQDPEKCCDKKYFYLELLKNLGKNEILLLKLLSKEANFTQMKSNENYYFDGEKVKSVMKLSQEEYELMILNLYRLKICDSLKSSGNLITIGDLPVLADAGIFKFRLTVIGYNLIQSCEE